VKELKTDVLVIGAGPSGIAAAIGAARCGSQVVLIEEDFTVGGAAVDYGVQSFCGEPICGVHKEIRDRLSMFEPYFNKTGCFHSYWLIHVTNKMISELGNISVITSTEVKKVVVGKEQNGRRQIEGVVVSLNNYGNIEEVKILAKVTIDCTGDGDIAAAAGCEFRYGRESQAEFNEEYAPPKSDRRVQLLTWMYTFQKTETGNDYILKGRAMGDNEFLRWGCAVECEDVTNPESLYKAQIKAWEAMLPDFEELKLKGCRLNYLAPKIGIRESRRVIGDYILKEGDLIGGKMFDDAIALAKYPIDSWEPDKDLVFVEVPWYQIPYRCLIPKETDGLLVAGRCISATHIAMSSFRVMPIVSNIGQAAGVAAALSVQNKVKPNEVNTSELQSELISEQQKLILEPPDSKNKGGYNRC